MKILVVDDSTFARGIVLRELKSMGFVDSQIQQSDNGEDALRVIAEQAFDVAILDIVMMGVDGIAVLKMIKSSQPTTKVIMCSSHSSPEASEELRVLGSDGFLLKPFSSQEFKALVGEVIGA